MEARSEREYWLQNCSENVLLNCVCPWDSFKKRCQGYLLYKKSSCLYQPWILLWIIQDLKNETSVSETANIFLCQMNLF